MSGVAGQPLGWVQVSVEPLLLPRKASSRSPSETLGASVAPTLGELFLKADPAICTKEMDDAAATGVTAFDAADSALLPTALVACTVNVYAVPLVRPVTTALVVDAPVVTVAPPGVAVTV